MIRPTPDEHGDDGEDLFGVRIGRDISESDARQTRAGEVESRNVGARCSRYVVRLVPDRCIQLFRQLIQPSYRSVAFHYTTQRCATLHYRTLHCTALNNALLHNALYADIHSARLYIRFCYAPPVHYTALIARITLPYLTPHCMV